MSYSFLCAFFLILGLVQKGDALGEQCSSSVQCVPGETCFDSQCLPGLTGLNCTSDTNCFGGRYCDPSVRICFKKDTCTTLSGCPAQESCLLELQQCAAGVLGIPCDSSQGCVSLYQCQNGVCSLPGSSGNDNVSEGEPKESSPLEITYQYSTDLVECITENTDAIPRSDGPVPPPWLEALLTVFISAVSAVAVKAMLKTNNVEFRRVSGRVFIVVVTFLGVALVTVSVLDRLEAFRQGLFIDRTRQAIAQCFPTESAVYTLAQAGRARYSNLVRIVNIGKLCETIGTVVIVLAEFWLIRRYLKTYQMGKLIIQKWKVIIVGATVTTMGLAAVFIGARMAANRITFSSPFCSIVESADTEYLLCDLDEQTLGNLTGIIFDKDTANRCLVQSQQNIELNTVTTCDSNELFDQIVNVTESTTTTVSGAIISSQVSPDQLPNYTLASFSWISSYFKVRPVGSIELLIAWVSLSFAKVFMELALAIIVLQMVTKNRRIVILGTTVAVLFVICEVAVQVTSSAFNSAVSLQTSASLNAVICGCVAKGEGVLDRSVEVGGFTGILRTVSGLIFAVIAFKELFTTGERKNEVVRVTDESTYPKQYDNGTAPEY